VADGDAGVSTAPAKRRSRIILTLADLPRTRARPPCTNGRTGEHSSDAGAPVTVY